METYQADPELESQSLDELWDALTKKDTAQFRKALEALVLCASANEHVYRPVGDDKK